MSIREIENRAVNGIEEDILVAMDLEHLPPGLLEKIRNQVNQFYRDIRSGVIDQGKREFGVLMNRAFD